MTYSDALKAAQQLKALGKAFRVHPDGKVAADQLEALRDLGALVDPDRQ
ncbi:hypothetical protein [Shinella sp. G-2]